jgi:hypothetical protein
MERDPYTIAMYLLILVEISSKVFLRMPYDCYILQKYIKEGNATDNRADPYYQEDWYQDSTITIVMSYIGNSALRIAISVNMTRWILLSLSLQDPT